ncbi:hypothetical protein H6775_02325 [Candidatus Nomurabacteria bacterium]|nr:hypothetical protein [Candidatus Nomurabacteria bacterium]
MDILEKLFGNAVRVKIMKLFLFHPESHFDKKDIIEKTKSNSSMVTKEVNLLEKIGFLRKVSFFKARESGKKRRTQGYVLDQTFKYIHSLQKMLIDSSSMDNKEIIGRLNRAGKIKLIVASGVFIQENDTRIDLLVVGDELNQRRIKNTISILEADIGKQLKYTIFNTNDFKYRMGIYDRLIRDIFDYPHQVVLDKIGL